MRTLLIALLLLFSARMLWRPKRQKLGFVAAVKDELHAGLLMVVIVLGMFLLLFALTLLFGPIAPVHEWGTN